MPRYFFDLADHENEPDDTGTELYDDNAARVAAIKFAGRYVEDTPDLIWDGKEIRVIARKEDRSVIFTVVVLAVDCFALP
jgi:hypothetical protein